MKCLPTPLRFIFKEIGSNTRKWKLNAVKATFLNLP